MIDLITHYLICVHCLKNVWWLLSLFGVRCSTIVLIFDRVPQSDIFLRLLFYDNTSDIAVQEVRHHYEFPPLTKLGCERNSNIALMINIKDIACKVLCILHT